MNPYARLLDSVGGLPDSYLVVDTETNGLSLKDPLTLPTQLGYLLAVDRKPVDCGAVVVNWARVLPAHLRAAFWDRVRRTEDHMAQRGQRCKVPAERIRAEGEDPRAAWPVYREMLATALAGGLKLAGHNLYAFDCPLLERVGLQMEDPLDLPADRVLDFGLFEKAHTAGLDFPHPDRGPIEQWYRYAKNAFSKGKWSLTPHCLTRYQLCADPALAHGADYDTWITYQLVEAHRALSEGTWPHSTPISSPPSRSPS